MDTVYENRQWKIYIDGDIDCTDGSYWIRADRLLEKGFEDDLYKWARHLAGKWWVDMDCFVEVWLMAIKFNKLEVDEDLLAKSIAAGYDKVVESVLYHRDRHLYKHHLGELLPEEEKLPADPVERLKGLTVNFKWEDEFDKWREAR
jgi:hypothetical protein